MVNLQILYILNLDHKEMVDKGLWGLLVEL